MNVRLAGSLLCVLCLGCGCATAAVSGPQPVPPLQALPDLSGAAALAPDYVARAHAAERAAAAADSDDARAAQQQRAHWLAQAALAEAERIALTRTVDAHEARIEAAQTARAQAERERLELDRQRVRDSAATLERTEAAWVFTQLARGVAKNTHERERIWAFLLRRATATLAAAGALGAASEELERANLQLTAARDSRGLGERIGDAQAALGAAHTALGHARARSPLASAAERADLIERLQERGFVATAGADGALLVDIGLAPVATGSVPSADAGPGPRITSVSALDRRRRFVMLAELLPAFPHGPLVLSCGRKVARECDAPNWLAPAERARVQGGAERVPLERPTTGSAPDAIQLALPAYTLVRAGP